MKKSIIVSTAEVAQKNAGNMSDTGKNGPSSGYVPTIILQSSLNSGFHFGSYIKPLETPQASFFGKIQKDPNLNTKQ